MAPRRGRAVRGARRRRTREPSTVKTLFPHHAQEQSFSCAPACFRMLGEWLTGAPQTEYAWRLATRMRIPGTDIADVEATLGRMAKELDLAIAPAPRQRWQALVERERGLPDDTVYLMRLDAYDADGTHAYHWVILLDVFDAKAGRGTQLVALLADPLASDLRAESWPAVLAQRVYEVYRITRKRPFGAGASETRRRRSTGRRPTR
jgi:hypothetical protein